MKKVGRNIFNGLTVLSLVLCVASVGMWVRSYYRSDWVCRLSAHRLYFAAALTAKGQLNVGLIGPMESWEADFYTKEPGWKVPRYRISQSSGQGELDLTLDWLAKDVNIFLYWRLAGFRWLRSALHD